VFVYVMRWELVCLSVGSEKNSARPLDNLLPGYRSQL